MLKYIAGFGSRWLTGLLRPVHKYGSRVAAASESTTGPLHVPPGRASRLAIHAATRLRSEHYSNNGWGRQLVPLRFTSTQRPRVSQRPSGAISGLSLLFDPITATSEIMAILGGTHPGTSAWRSSTASMRNVWRKNSILHYRKPSAGVGMSKNIRSLDMP